MAKVNTTSTAKVQSTFGAKAELRALKSRHFVTMPRMGQATTPAAGDSAIAT